MRTVGQIVYRFVILIVMISLPSFVAAETIYQKCKEAIIAHELDKVMELSNTIKRFNNIPAQEIDNAVLCVSVGQKEEMVFRAGKFMTLDEADLQIQKQAQEKQAKNESIQPSGDACAEKGKLAKLIMELRQDNAPMDEMIAVAKGDKSTIAIVIEAYDRPRMSVPENQQRAINDFMNDVMLECYKN